jgi:pyruvate,water dikinase
METVLDQLGRLLGTSRLLDMALKTPEQVVKLTESFLQGKYDFLEPERTDAPTNFFLITGDWRNSTPDMETGILQDGSRFVSSISIGVTQTMVRFMGQRYQEFLDNVEVYCYFPLMIAKDSSMADGAAQVWVKPEAGTIDQAGGLAFAIRDFINDQQVMEYEAERSLSGLLGLWTKADSVTLFKELTMQPKGEQPRLL